MLPKSTIRGMLRTLRGSQAQIVERLRNDGDGRGTPALVSLWTQGKIKSARVHRVASEFCAEIQQRRSQMNHAPETLPAQWWRL